MISQRWTLAGVAVLTALVLACSDDGPDQSSSEPTAFAALTCEGEAILGVGPPDAPLTEVGKMLLNRWLVSFRAPSCGERQLAEYEIHELELRSTSADRSVVEAKYSVRLLQPPAAEDSNPWLTDGGDQDDDGWVNDKMSLLHIQDRGSGRFTLVSMSTSP